MANLNGLWKDENNLLDEAKQNKKRELSRQCEEDILRGFYTSLDGEEYRVSYDREAQVNMQERWSLFENGIIEAITLTLHIKEDDTAIRKTVTKEQFERIYLDGVKAKEDKISRLRDILIPMVESATSIEEVELIKWDNIVNAPEEPSIEISNENTLRKKVNQVNQKVDRLNQNVSMTNAGLLELSTLFMGF